MHVGTGWGSMECGDGTRGARSIAMLGSVMGRGDESGVRKTGHRHVGKKMFQTMHATTIRPAVCLDVTHVRGRLRDTHGQKDRRWPDSN
jgi:hypothetical protein